MTTGRQEREGGLDARAMAALQAFRAEEEMPPATQARVWARVAASTRAEAAWSSGQVRRRRNEWVWAGLAVAAAAGLLLATRAGVVGPLGRGDGGEAAAYSGRQETATTATERGRPGGAGATSERGANGHVESDMSARTSEDSSPAPEAGRAEERRVGQEPAGAGARVVGSQARGTSGTTGSQGPAAGKTGSSGPESIGAPGGTSSHEADGAPGGAGSQEPSATGSLAQEAEALAQAQAAIQGGRADEALSLLAGYAKRFPAGVLREEHDALRALALCASERTREGRAAAQVFLREHGSSALAERVRKGCLDG